MSYIEDMEETVERLEGRLNEARKELFAARVEAHPWNIGDILIDRKGRRGKIIRFTSGWAGSQYIDAVVNQFKKNGALGKCEIRCYSFDGWEKVT